MRTKGLYSTLLPLPLCFPTNHVRRNSQALIAEYIPFSLLWECDYMWFLDVTASFLQTKCGILERTGQNVDSKKPGDPQLAASWHIFSLGCTWSLQYFAVAWLCFSILCMVFLCRVMPVKDNGSFFSVSP